jgi:hypothetical protein
MSREEENRDEIDAFSGSGWIGDCGGGQWMVVRAKNERGFRACEFFAGWT